MPVCAKLARYAGVSLPCSRLRRKAAALDGTLLAHGPSGTARDARLTQPGPAGRLRLLRQLCLLSIFALAGCGSQTIGQHFELNQVTAYWSDGYLNATLHQTLTLSREAREALVHGVPLTVKTELIIRNTGDGIRREKNLESYEIRYLPLSEHYQLTAADAREVRTFRRLRHLLADLSIVSLTFSTGVLPAGEYELLVRTRLDQQKIPPPMRLPVLFSSEWRHDSDWSAWPLYIRPQV
jgi:hypothetical protein